MALWKAGGGSLNKNIKFRSWHCGRQRGGSLNKNLEFGSWHCGRQGGGAQVSRLGAQVSIGGASE